MKSYPTISKQVQSVFIYAFDKLDGSNIRAEWSRKNSFYKFGSRTQLLDGSNPFLLEAPDIVRNKYERDLSNIFIKERMERVVCFFEFWGPNSFAGNHQKEPHDVTFFDVDVYKHGIMNPSNFLRLFGNLDIAKLVYKGMFNNDFLTEVLWSQNPLVTFEGTVCKSPEVDKHGHPIMFKIKSDAWKQKLKDFCKGDDKLYEKLL